MKENIKYLMLGFLLCLIFSSVLYGASELSEVYISSFPIKLNGQGYSPEMPVLNYQGRTYLALREFGTVTGNTIDFQDNTILITNSQSTETADGLNNANTKTIYITPTGSRYHYDSNCSGGTYIASTLDTALNLGLTLCKIGL